ncbi:hypothetical protein Tco_0981181 [Tanacetum coccineum]
MEDANPIRTLRYYYKPSREGYRNTFELPVGNNVGESLLESWTRFKDLLQKVPHHGINLWLKLRDINAEESWALLEDLALYDNESWNDPRNFAKLVKAISLPQDVPSTSDRRLIELKNQVQCLIEAHLAPTQPTQVNKITSSCEICSGPYDTQYCMENPEQAFVENSSSRTDEARVLKAITDRIAGALLSDTVKNPKLNVNSTTSVLSARSYLTEDPQCSTHIHGSINTIMIHPKQQSDSHDHKPEENEGEEKNRDDGDVMFIEIVKKNDKSHKEEPEVGGLEYYSLSDLEKEHTKSVYLRSEEDKRRGVEYVMSKILEFYKECLELGPEYVTGMDDEGEVMQGRVTSSRKAYLLEDKQILSVGVFDEVFRAWMAFRGNTRDLSSFGEETDKTTTLHQILEEVVHTECGDGVASFKRRRQDCYSLRERLQPLSLAYTTLQRLGFMLTYLLKRDCHCAYLPVASIGGRSLEPAAMMSLCI